MPMFDSDEAFEAYVAQQQAELTGNPPAQPAVVPTQLNKSVLVRWHLMLAGVVPIGLAVVIGAFLWTNAPDPSKASSDPWDNILGSAAWATGREYNADANTLTERLTLRKPGDHRGGE